MNPRSSTSGGQVPASSIAFPRYDSVAGSSEIATHHRYESTVSFPGTGRFSINRASALELHDLIYGSGNILDNANSETARAALDKLYEPTAVYSNPLLTASSGNVIKDIHSLMHHFTALSIPTPFSILGRMWSSKNSVKWLNVAKVWSEVGEVLESDVYDGHRRVVIEHTVYLLLLPDAFAPEPSSSDAMMIHSSASSISLPESTYPGTPGHGGRPQTLGNAARVLGTLARQVSLPVHTRLSFNDSGRITHHQDIWDVKDVVNLIPGMSVAQWIGSRVLAHGLSGTFDFVNWASTAASESAAGSVRRDSGEETPRGHNAAGFDLEHGSEAATSDMGSTKATSRVPSSTGLNALGLQLSDRFAAYRTRGGDGDSAF